jgi:hypothetical protein
MSYFRTKQAMQITGISLVTLQNLHAHDIDFSIGIRDPKVGREYTEHGCARLLLVNKALTSFGMTAKVSGFHLLNAQGMWRLSFGAVTVIFDVDQALEEVRKRAAALGFLEAA